MKSWARVIFFKQCLISHFAAQSFSAGAFLTGDYVLCFMGLYRTRGFWFQFHFLYFTKRIWRMLNHTAVTSLLYILDVALHLLQFGHSAQVEVISGSPQDVNKAKSGKYNQSQICFTLKCLVLILRSLSRGRTTTKQSLCCLSWTLKPTQQRKGELFTTRQLDSFLIIGNERWRKLKPNKQRPPPFGAGKRIFVMSDSPTLTSRTPAGQVSNSYVLLIISSIWERQGTFHLDSLLPHFTSSRSLLPFSSV